MCKVDAALFFAAICGATVKIASCSLALSPQAIGNALYGLQGMDGSCVVSLGLVDMLLCNASSLNANISNLATRELDGFIHCCIAVSGSKTVAPQLRLAAKLK